MVIHVFMIFHFLSKLFNVAGHIFLISSLKAISLELWVVFDKSCFYPIGVIDKWSQISSWKLTISLSFQIQIRWVWNSVTLQEFFLYLLGTTDNEVKSHLGSLKHLTKSEKSRKTYFTFLDAIWPCLLTVQLSIERNHQE